MRIEDIPDAVQFERRSAELIKCGYSIIGHAGLDPRTRPGLGQSWEITEFQGVDGKIVGLRVPIYRTPGGAAGL